MIDDRLEAIFEYATIGIASVALDGRCLQVNQCLCEMFGYSKAELLALSWQDVTPADELAIDLQQLSRLIAGEVDSYQREKQFLSNNRPGFWGLLRVKLMRNATGEPDYYICLVEDITVRRNAELALRESQARLQEAKQLARLGHWHWDLRNNSHTWSEEIYEIYGHDHNLPPAFYPEVKEYFAPDSWEKLSAAVENTLTTQMPYECDAEVIRSDNTRRWIIARGKVSHDQTGNIVALSGTVQDITARKAIELELYRSKEQLSATLHASNLGTWQWNLITNEVVWSENLWSMFGIEDLSMLASFDSWQETIEEVDREKVLNAILRATSRSEELEVVWQVKLPTNAPSRWLMARGTPLLKSNGKVDVYQGIIIDITDQKTREQQIEILSNVNATLAYTNRLTQHAQTEDELFNQICQTVVEKGGMAMAWIGRQIDLASELIKPVARFGVSTDYLDGIVISINPNVPEGKGPTALVLRNGKPVVIHDFPSNPTTQPWKSRAQATGKWRSSGAYPIFRNGEAYAVLNIYHLNPNVFSGAIHELLTAMAADISFALDVLDTKERHRQASNALHISEERYQFISSLTSDLFFTSYSQGHGNQVIDWIEGDAKKLFGCELSELKEFSNWQQFVIPEDRHSLSHYLSQIEHNQSSHLILRIRHRDGSIRHIRYLLKNVFNSENQSERIFGSLQDITVQQLAEIKLRENQALLTAMFNQAAVGLAHVNTLSNRFLWVNPRYEQILGRSLEELQAHSFTDVTHPDDIDLSLDFIDKLKRGLSHYTIEKRYIRSDQSVVWVALTVSPLWRPGEKPSTHVAVVQDITARKLDEEQLRLARRVLNTTLEGVIITDSQRKVVEVNDAFTKITGIPKSEILGQNPRILKSGLHDAEFYKSLWHNLNATGHWSGEIWNRRKDGKLYPEWITISAINDDKGKITHYVGIFSDITLLKQHEKQLEHIAHYDALTGIPNRVLLVDRMQQALAQTRREKKLLAICYLDLDGFKPINDTLGHSAGDSVLIEIAKRIQHTLRGGDTVARLGGDEFVILLLGIENIAECYHSLDRLMWVIADSIVVEGQSFSVTASIGVTLYPQNDQDPDTLLRHADQAMYQAKQLGKNQYLMFDPHEDNRLKSQYEQRKLIKSGFIANEFELYYQPKVSLSERNIAGTEALIRWNHPKQGLLSPIEFLPYIVNTELDIKLGEWVIGQALSQIDRWNQHGLILEVSINISAYHLQSAAFVSNLEQQLINYSSNVAHQLQIEILETAALSDISIVSAIIDRCAELGVSFALDDFGTGYSSLSYLRRLPATTLKIDQSFVRDMLSDKEDRALIKGIIALAKTFDRTTVAEGVESEAHFNMLRDMGCQIGQGYGIARPMPAQEIESWAQRFIGNIDNAAQSKNLDRRHQEIHWSTKFEIGHDRIDFEHRIFLDLIIAVNDKVNTSCDCRQINRLLNEIVEYARFHFVSEENIMEEIEYPELELHKLLHSELLSKITKLINVNSTKDLDYKELVDFLYEWFVSHTAFEDKKIALFIDNRQNE